MNNVFKRRNTFWNFAEVDHTGIFKWEPTTKIETCPLFELAYSYEANEKRYRRFVTNFSNN